MELKQITENVYYIPNTTNIGVIKKDNSAILIDSGLDDDAAKKVLKCLEINHLTPIAIINTHSHADHCGGNAFFQSRFDVMIYASEMEAEFIKFPYFEPFFLFSGANPVKDMKNKFVMAKPSQVGYTIKSSDNTVIIGDITLEILRLPGHSANQIGIAFQNILFCGDFVFSTDVLAKHKIPFCADLDKQRNSLDSMKLSKYRLYIPSHGEPTECILPLIDAYEGTISGMEDLILRLLSQKKTTEVLEKELFDILGVEIKNIQQHYLMNTAVMAYLSSLYGRGMIQTVLVDNHLFWQMNN